MSNNLINSIDEMKPADIQSVSDIKHFFTLLMEKESVNFHPDTPFNDYSDREGNDTFTPAAALHRDALMDKCFEVCGANDDLIYQIAIDASKEYENK